jgi:hypothetical protein
METFRIVVFYLLLVDSLIANIIAFGCRGWYITHFRTFSRYFPITKPWAALYLILVLWIGFLTF